MNITKKIILGIIVLVLISSIYLNPLSIGGDDGYIDLNVPCVIQFDCDSGCPGYPYHAYCGAAVEIMIMRFYDENYGTNYFGNPFDEELLCEYQINSLFEDMFEEFGHIDPHIGGSMQELLWYWASSREQPSLLVKTYMNSNNLITYDFCESILEQGIPYLAFVKGGTSGGHHCICGFGTIENPWGPGDAIKYYNTWTCNPVYIVPEDYSPSDYWYHLGVSVVEMGVLGDINYDGKLNSADVRYLAMHLCGHPDYWRVTKEQGDVNNDGNFNSADVRYLAMHLCGHPLYATLYP